MSPAGDRRSAGRDPRRVPRPLAFLLRGAIPTRDLGSVLGDLAEDAASHRGPGRILWLVRQTVTLLFWSSIDRRRHRPTLPVARPFMLSNLCFELRSALRSLRRSPGFAAAVLTTIAVGIAGTTTVFAIVHGILLAPLDYPQPDRLVALWSRSSASKALFEDLRTSLDSLAQLAAWSGSSRVMRSEGEGPTLLIGPDVTADFLPALGYGAEYGRLLRPDDSAPGAAPVVVITHELLESRFGGDPGVVGTTITLDEMEWTVIGVLPPGADVLQRDATIVTPLRLDPDDRGYRTGYYLDLIARLEEGVTMEQASAELRAVAAALEEYSFSDRQLSGLSVVPLQERLVGDRRPLLVLMFGAVALVMTIACVNVGNLNLARQLTRRQEVAVRAALGGGRGRGVLFLAAESLLLAAAGGALGLAAAAWMLGALRAASPLDLPRLAGVGLDPLVVGFSFALTALAALAAGVLPGLRAARLDPAQALRPGRSTSAGRREGLLREGLVVVEVALAVVLTAGAGLLGRSLWTLASVDPGFDAEDRLLVQIVPPAHGPDRPFDVAAYYDRLIDGFTALPTVERVGSVHTAPVRGGGWVMSTEQEGVEYAESSEIPLAYWRVVSPGYFAALGARVRGGRGFTSDDVAGAEPVAVVNTTLARERWPDSDPIGRKLRIGFDSADWLTVVGVIDDVRLLGPGTPTPPTVYRPLAQAAAALQRVGVTSQSLVVHTRGEPMAALPAIREALRDLDPGAPILAPAPLRTVVWESMAEPRLLLQVIGLFGSAALLLAAVGIAGVVGYLVRQRRRELGIRQALGARPAQVLGHCLRRGLTLGGLGLAIGIAGALATGPLLASFLFEVSPRDPVSLGVVVVLLAACVALASWIPSRRAARIDPAEALRSD